MKLLMLSIAVVAASFGAVRQFDGVENHASGSVQAPPSGAFVLTANGDDGNCVVYRGAPVSAGLSVLAVPENCHALLPGIDRAKFWKEGDDGTVAFSADGVDPIVTFGIADGEGYESFAPREPLMALAPAR